MVVKSVMGKMMKIFVNPRHYWQRYEFSSLTAKDLHGKVYPVLMSIFFVIVLFGSGCSRGPSYQILLMFVQKSTISGPSARIILYVGDIMRDFPCVWSGCPAEK